MTTNITPAEILEAQRPIASLASKSEKALQKLTPGTWQHTMLGDNLKMLRIAAALMNHCSGGTDSFTRDELQDALRSCAAMITKVETIAKKFTPGTSQHTLQHNRLKALRVAEWLIKKRVGAPGAPTGGVITQ